MADAASPAPRPYLELRPLLRAPGIASDARVVILAAVGLLAFYAGRFAIDAAFGVPGGKGALGLPAAGLEELLVIPRTGLVDGDWHLADPYRTIVAPFAALFTRGVGPLGWLRAALVAFWATVVWGIVGGAITRVAVVRAAVDGRVGLKTAVRFALGRAWSLVAAPLMPMLAVAVLAAGCALFGLLYRIPAGAGGVGASVLGFVPLALGLVMAFVLVGLALGWPLMHATIAAEGEDAPDALSRSYSYVNQRLVRYAAHAAAAFAIGSVGLAVVIAFARVVMALADWGVALGAPDLDALGEPARSGRLFWDRAVGLLVMAWAYGYLWSAASIVYLILRRDVDGTAWHDVFIPEHDADASADAPKPTAGDEPSKAIGAEV